MKVEVGDLLIDDKSDEWHDVIAVNPEYDGTPLDEVIIVTIDRDEEERHEFTAEEVNAMVEEGRMRRITYGTEGYFILNRGKPMLTGG